MYSAKLKVDFINGEFEIAGEEGFVRDLVDTPGKISYFLKELHKELPNKEMIKSSNNNSEIILEAENSKKDLIITNTIGEWFQKFKKDLIEKEKALIAAYYIQIKSAENEFKTIEVTKVLKDYGTSLSNNSFFLNSLQSQGYIFPVEKKENVMFRRVSKDGVEYLETLIRE